MNNKMDKKIAVIRGDGIGPEIVNEAIRVLDAVAKKYNHNFEYTDVDMGGCAIDKWGEPLPKEMLEKCLASDSVLLGAVGGPKWDNVPGDKRPEKGLLALRGGIAPATTFPQLHPLLYITSSIRSALPASYSAYSSFRISPEFFIIPIPRHAASHFLKYLPTILFARALPLFVTADKYTFLTIP